MAMIHFHLGLLTVGSEGPEVLAYLLVQEPQEPRRSHGRVSGRWAGVLGHSQPREPVQEGLSSDTKVPVCISMSAFSLGSEPVRGR